MLIVVYLAGVTGLWWPTPDSALYQSLAKSLLAGHGYRYNGQPSTAATPGLPLLLAGLKAALGPHANWAANLLTALCGLALVLASYLTVARIASRRMAWFVALMVGLCYKSYELSHLVLTDIPFAAVFWWLVYVCLRYLSAGRWVWLIVAGALAAVGVTVRAPGLLALVALGPALILDYSSSTRPRRRWAVAGVVVVTSAAVALAYYQAAIHLAAEVPSYVTHAGEGLTSRGAFVARVREAMLVPAAVPMVLGEMVTSQELPPLGVVLMALGLVGLVSLWIQGRRLTPVVVVLYTVGLVLVAGAGGIRERYLLPIYPLIVLSVLEGLCVSIHGAAALARWNSRLCLAVMVAAGVVALETGGVGVGAGLVGRLETGLLTVCAVAAAAALLAWSGLISLRRSQARQCLRAVWFAVGLTLAINLPRLACNAFYYGHLGRTDPAGYYATSHRGKFTELFDVVDLLRTAGLPRGPLAASDDEAAVLHYLTGRLVRPVPEQPRDTADWADVVYDKYVATDAKLYVTSIPEAQAPFRDRIEARFAETKGLAVIHTGEQYVVYRHLPPAATAASQAASRPQSP